MCRYFKSTGNPPILPWCLMQIPRPLLMRSGRTSAISIWLRGFGRIPPILNHSTASGNSTWYPNRARNRLTSFKSAMIPATGRIFEFPATGRLRALSPAIWWRRLLITRCIATLLIHGLTGRAPRPQPGQRRPPIILSVAIKRYFLFRISGAAVRYLFHSRV